jgi:hypothetical protein
MNKKENTHMKEGIATSGLTKKDHYSWQDMDSPCRHQRIKISELNVDNTYQRGEASNTSTIEKAKSMQYAAMSAIVVAKRPDGTYWIVDGLQRTLAAKRRGDIDHIDCMVFDSKGQNHEAEVFLLCNKGRVPVKAMHKYKTSVAAGRTPESEIDKWLLENGFSVNEYAGESIIRFPSKLVQNWEMNESACKQALSLTREICQTEVNADVFCAIAILIRNGINVRQEVSKIISLGGQSRILKEINAIAITLGISRSLKACGLGLLSVINHKRQKKIRVESWSK